ncbi:PREDICTED: uncharacterized protein LOC106147315 [Chinchilla lanigera]|uniref:uncharacterized protein LOC106147315 n=1 Tax=Chinchilla lanigera TaxID=34839 RepID=UPI000696724B|nr:PREDICTED: uncharacterized protein LOC106147315 [Chinchilla lanigera]
MALVLSLKILALQKEDRKLRYCRTQETRRPQGVSPVQVFNDIESWDSWQLVPEPKDVTHPTGLLFSLQRCKKTKKRFWCNAQDMCFCASPPECWDYRSPGESSVPPKTAGSFENNSPVHLGHHRSIIFPSTSLRAGLREQSQFVKASHVPGLLPREMAVRLVRTPSTLLPLLGVTRFASLLHHALRRCKAHQLFHFPADECFLNQRITLIN